MDVPVTTSSLRLTCFILEGRKEGKKQDIVLSLCTPFQVTDSMAQVQGSDSTGDLALGSLETHPLLPPTAARTDDCPLAPYLSLRLLLLCWFVVKALLSLRNLCFKGKAKQAVVCLSDGETNRLILGSELDVSCCCCSLPEGGIREKAPSSAPGSSVCCPRCL